MATESFWGGTDKAAYKFRCPIYSRNQPKVEKGCHRQRMFGVLDLYILRLAFMFGSSLEWHTCYNYRSVLYQLSTAVHCHLTHL